ncbi:unnamed protein product [Cyprideis torosa]|uniref:Uncharacterized protein n=1 Tax=Cyprideis torosa TaxID=163714 RepID=A0A7R8W5L9_9CRUS|nr:unnamed protein product [Cyprideis torosa]CAG0884451.1 unnamed protein product [Cyprideis torosa]
MKGRGRLGRWGPNHAADPIVTMWKRDEESGEIVCRESDGKGVLMFVAIQRTDTGEWAIPGGMVDPGELISSTLKREFLEEALDSTSASKQRIQEIEAQLDEFFSAGGQEVYRGYVDDPRNTDNAWMETVAVNFHDETGEVVGNLKFEAGSDAGHASWIEIESDLSLYASHKDFIMKVARRHNASV